MTTTLLPAPTCVLALTAACLALVGCVKRSETMRVEPDGTAHLEAVFEGDPGDIRDGDAMLEDPGPWEVEDEIETKDDGERELTLPCHGFQAEILGAVLFGGRAAFSWSFSSQPTHRDHFGGLTS